MKKLRKTQVDLLTALQISNNAPELARSFGVGVPTMVQRLENLQQRRLAFSRTIPKRKNGDPLYEWHLTEAGRQVVEVAI